MRNGFVLVDFFFILSGVGVARGCRVRIPGAFSIWRSSELRLERIYPLHLAMLVPLVALESRALRYG